MTELAEALEDGLLVVSPGGGIDAVNTAAARLLACPREALRSLADLPDARALSRACEDACTRGAEVRTRVRPRCGPALDVRVVPADRGVWMFLRPAPSPSSTDVYLRSVLDHAPVVLFALDPDGVITMSEGRGLVRIGRLPGENVGRSIFELYADVPWLVDGARLALAGAESSAYGPVGDAVFQIRFAPTRAADGRVSGVLGVALDVTERERAVESLAAQQSVLRYILANIPQAIFWKDRAGRFLGCNQQFLNHTGVASEEQVLGRTDRELFPNRDEVAFFEEVDHRVMATGVPILNIEESLQRLDGRASYLLTSKVPIRDARGEVTGVLGIFVDITERKRIELELQKAKEEADAALKIKSEFLTVMSHELRTPLALVLGPLENLLTADAEALPPHVCATLTRIWRNATRLRRLVDDILDYQTLEAGKLIVRWEPIDVCGLVEGLVADAEPAARSAGLTLGWQCELDASAVPLDRRMFEKIVLNLLGNALKFTPRGGAITVTLARSPGGFTLAVADSGPGIPPGERERIFQRFEQLDGTAARRFEGTGLGLAIVRDFARAMGGRVTLDSEVGRGSRFGVELPIDPDSLVGAGPAARVVAARPVMPAIPEPAEPPAPARAAGERARLLVVEDNADMRTYLEELLGGEFEVTSAETGAAALSLAPVVRPEAIVSDIMMPEMDGYELVSRLKRSPDLREIPVILLSARTSREETVRGLDVGADDYLPKPFGPDELRARARAAVRIRRAHLELAAQKAALERTLASLQKAQEQLVHASKLAAVGTLIAGLSHELNNPIAVVQMSAQMLLRRGTVDPFLQRTLERIERNSNRCAQLVSALLEYTRGKPPVAERCELGDVLRSLVQLVAPEAAERGITLRADFDPEQMPAIVAQRPELETALLNVVGNAADATPRGGTVELSAHPIADDHVAGVEIVVRDTGAGIPARDLPRIFEPFFTTKEPGKGTGLGLPMTYKFVRSQGGTIDVDSAPGRGTTVRIRLPRTPPGRREDPGEPGEAAR